MGASLSNPHFLAFADHYNDARDAGRAPMNWRQFLHTRALGPGAELAELSSWDMDAHVEAAAAQRRASAIAGHPFHPLLDGNPDASKEADIDVLKAQVQSLNMALEESRQQASTGVAASLEALEPRTLSASELAALRAALPRAVSAVETEVSRRLVAAEATRSDARDVREDEALCVCCLDRPRDIVFLSCMHVVVCEQCAPRTASCPTCRVPITEKRRIFR